MKSFEICEKTQFFNMYQTKMYASLK
uniref:Uncharacterized protein n=1 Tax=Anguilla anguilla TaxID=7936 RepID=A0A0E9PJ78_ANGAN